MDESIHWLDRRCRFFFWLLFCRLCDNGCCWRLLLAGYSRTRIRILSLDWCLIYSREVLDRLFRLGCFGFDSLYLGCFVSASGNNHFLRSTFNFLFFLLDCELQLPSLPIGSLSSFDLFGSLHTSISCLYCFLRRFLHTDGPVLLLYILAPGELGWRSLIRILWWLFWLFDLCWSGCVIDASPYELVGGA